jgi:hypothetical protein
MNSSVVVQLVRAHRSILVLSTVVLSIAGSRVASTPGDWTDWLFLVAAAIMLFVADICREIDEVARQLAVSSSRTPQQARRDVFQAQAPKRTVSLLAVAVVLAIIATVLKVTS